jgi:mannan endo-1,4-beta-mannosidase
MKNLLLNLLFIPLLIIGILSCKSDDDISIPDDGDPDTEEPIETGISPDALKLLTNLKNNANQGNILVGHQATTIAGVGWRLWQMPDHSDFKAVSGKFPAVYGWEMSPRPDNQNETYDYVSFDTTMNEAKKAYNRGGVNIFNMHPYRLDNNGNSWDAAPGLVSKMIPGGNLHDQYKTLLDKYVAEFSKLKNNSGTPIPFIYRPYHEANHNWFWWGSASCTDAEYKTLFRFTVEYMRGKGLTNMLICYAPGYFQNESTFWARYPGDDVVDILGFDGYYGNNNGHGTDWNTLKNHLNLLKTFGQSKNKPIIWAETGELNLSTSTYFTQLNQAISEVGAPIASLMFWANYQNTEYYVPYSALPNNGVKLDFQNFLQMPKYQVEGEHGNMYQ